MAIAWNENIKKQQHFLCFWKHFMLKDNRHSTRHFLFSLSFRANGEKKHSRLMSGGNKREGEEEVEFTSFIQKTLAEWPCFWPRESLKGKTLIWIYLFNSENKGNKNSKSVFSEMNVRNLIFLNYFFLLSGMILICSRIYQFNISSFNFFYVKSGIS